MGLKYVEIVLFLCILKNIIVHLSQEFHFPFVQDYVMDFLCFHLQRRVAVSELVVLEPDKVSKGIVADFYQLVLLQKIILVGRS